MTLFLNFNPVVCGDGNNYSSSFTFTDKAETEENYLWMFPEHAPDRDSVAFLEILNVDYKKQNESLPAGKDNEQEDHPYYIYANWVWVIDVVNYRFVTNLEEQVDLDVRRPVKVILKELRGVLEYRFNARSYNRPTRLTNIQGNSFHPFYPLSEDRPVEMFDPINWEELEDLFRHEGLTVRTTVINELGEAVRDPELFDLMPYNLMWFNLPFSQCLEYFADIFQVRVLEKCLFYPDRPEPEVVITNGQQLIPEGIEDLSEVYFKRPKKIEYDENIIYENMRYSPQDARYLSRLSSIEVVLPTFADSVSPESLDLRNAIPDNVKDIVLPGLLWDNDNASLTTALKQYIVDNRINSETIYEFQCNYLPHTFYPEREWTFINYTVKNKILKITCAHEYKPRPFIPLRASEDEVQEKIYKGVIVGANNSFVAVVNNESPGINFLPIPLGNFAVVGDNPNYINGDLQGRTVLYNNIDSNPIISTADSELTLSEFNVSEYVLDAQVIEEINHKIENFNFIPSDDFYDSSYPEVFKFEIDLLSDNSTTPSTQKFIQGFISGVPQFVADDWVNETVRLRLTTSEEDLVSYFASQSDTDLPTTPVGREALAKYIKKAYEELFFKVSFSLLASDNSIFVYYLSSTPTGNAPITPVAYQRRGIMFDMDLDEVNFSSYGQFSERDGLNYNFPIFQDIENPSSGIITNTKVGFTLNDYNGLGVNNEHKLIYNDGAIVFLNAFLQYYRQYQQAKCTFSVEAIPNE